MDCIGPDAFLLTTETESCISASEYESLLVITATDSTLRVVFQRTGVRQFSPPVGLLSPPVMDENICGNVTGSRWVGCHSCDPTNSVEN